MDGTCRGSYDTRRQICKVAAQLFQRDHECPLCQQKDNHTSREEESGPPLTDSLQVNDSSSPTAMMEDSTSSTHGDHEEAMDEVDTTEA